MHALQNTVKKKGHVFWVASSQGAGVWGRGNRSWWQVVVLLHLHPPPSTTRRPSPLNHRQRKHCRFLLHLLPSGDHFFLQILQIKSCLPILEYSFYNKNLRWSSYHFFCNFCCWHLFSNHCSRYQFGKFCSRQLFCMLIFWTALAKLAFQTTFLQRWLKGKCDQGGRLTGSKRVKG